MDKKILKKADIIILRDQKSDQGPSINSLRNMLGLLRSCLGKNFKYSYAPTRCSIIDPSMSLYDYFDEAQNMKGMKDSRDALVFPPKINKMLSFLGDLHRPLQETDNSTRQLISLIEAMLNPAEYLLIDSPATHLSKSHLEILKNYVHEHKQQYKSIIILSQNSEYWHRIADYFVDYNKEKGVYTLYDNNLKKQKEVSVTTEQNIVETGKKSAA